MDMSTGDTELINTLWFVAKNKKDLEDNVGFTIGEVLEYPVIVLVVDSESDICVFIEHQEIEKMLKQLEESKYEPTITA